MSTRAIPTTGNDDRCGTTADGAITPTQRMMLAILNDALATFERGLRSAGAAEVEALEEVERWFASGETSRPFSYEKVCECLALDPSFVRDALRMVRLDALESVGRRAASDARYFQPVRGPVSRATAAGIA